MAELWINYIPGLHYIGVETDKSCHDRLKGLGVVVKEEVDSGNEDLQADLFILSHVLEHLKNPLEYMSMISDSLREGGAVFIDVPCRDFSYKKIVEPHLLFFNKKSLGGLLSRVGFSSIEIDYWGKQITSQQENYFFIKTQLVFGLISKIGLAPLVSYLIKGPLILDSAKERLALAPFKAHIKSVFPAWWIRALAVKSPIKNNRAV